MPPNASTRRSLGGPEDAGPAEDGGGSEGPGDAEGLEGCGDSPRDAPPSRDAPSRPGDGDAIPGGSDAFPSGCPGPDPAPEPPPAGSVACGTPTGAVPPVWAGGSAETAGVSDGAGSVPLRCPEHAASISVSATPAKTRSCVFRFFSALRPMPVISPAPFPRAFSC